MVLNFRNIVSLMCASILLVASPVLAQSFSLDDNPFMPINPACPPGPIPGFGAEDPFGIPAPPWWPPGLAPSPSIAIIPGIGAGDGDILSPGPVVQMFSPNGCYVDAWSINYGIAGPPPPSPPIKLAFSVDRFSFGAPGTAVSAEAALNQQPGDIFETTDLFVAPVMFAGTLGGGPFAGWLAAPMGGPASNVVTNDESWWGLLCGGAVVPPGVMAPPPLPGSHDNVDAYDARICDANGDLLHDRWFYFAIYPDEAMMAGISAADILDVAPGAPAGAPFPPYAPAMAMGLDLVGGPNSDSIDALIVFDNNVQGGPANGGPGAEPAVDFALFSLAPGSISLLVFGLDAADVFFTDFTGAFAVYGPSPTLGLMGVPPGLPGLGDNLDALDLVLAPGAPTFSIDDNPSMPIGPPGVIPGFGAENPFGLPAPPWWPPGLAPSPSLATIPGLMTFDGDLLSPGPIVQGPPPNGFFVGAFSNNTFDSGRPIALSFSVDRFSFGLPPGAVFAEAMLNQQPGDVYESTDRYLAPMWFAGTLPGGPFAGWLFASMGGPPSNLLRIDDSALGLVCGGVVVPPGVMAPPIMPGTHDNVDALDLQLLASWAAGYLNWTYFTLYPDEAFPVGISPADILDIPPGAGGGVPFPPYAPAMAMGLDWVGPNSDAIDALVVFDNGAPGGPAWGGPGAEPVIDYALFSLAPGSASLAAFGVDAADVFFTDFTGAFAVYAPSVTLGLRGVPGGFPGTSDNLDALELPCPGDLNGDGIVGLSDLAMLLANYGMPAGAVYTDGDIDGDGDVDLSDLAALLGVYGMICP